MMTMMNQKPPLLQPVEEDNSLELICPDVIAQCHFDMAIGKTFNESVHADPTVPFNSPHRNGFLPGIPATVSIEGVERISDLNSRLSPFVYRIQLTHGPFSWTINRRYHHFLKLHTSLFMSRSRSSRSHHKSGSKETAQPTNSLALSTSSRGDDGESTFARFPKKPDMLLPQDSQAIEERKRQLSNYLQDLLNSDELRNHKDLLDFLEVSEYSFMKHSVKRKEGFVRRRIGDGHSHGWVNRLTQQVKWLLCFPCRPRWKKTWLIVQDTSLVALNHKTGEVRTVFLFDHDLAYSYGKKQTGMNKAVLLSNYSRAFYIKATTSRRTEEWASAIKEVATSEPGKLFIQANPHGSFAPERKQQSGCWFVDGQDFMSAVADAILAAKEEIFIADWWLSPEIYLKRGKYFSEDMRLDRLLKRKSSEGVRIFILLYKEFQLALGLTSIYTKRELMLKGGKNIKVLRHPDRKGGDVNDFLWAHHEKLVVIDQSLAFVGGIDLCYGRWDTCKHPLTDVTGMANTDNAVTKASLLIQQPATSTRSQQRLAGVGEHLAFALKKVHEVTVTPLRSNEPQEGTPADEPDGGEASGGMKNRIKQAVKRAKSKINKREDSEDLSDSEYGLNEEEANANGVEDEADGGHKMRSRLKKVMSIINKGGKGRKVEAEAAAELNYGFELDSHDTDGPQSASSNPMSLIEDEDAALEANGPLWRGKDYVNFIVKDVSRPDIPDADNVDRRTTPRMPWHDVSVMVSGSAGRDVARHFIQRWNAVKSEKAKFDSKYPYLVPRPYEKMDQEPNLLADLTSVRAKFKVKCQVLRSCSSWSAGIDHDENSIYSALISTIENAKHFLYIENQFFITSSAEPCEASDSRDVKNIVGNAIFNRILKAHRENTPFKVYILLPLLPAFEGQIGSASTGNSLRAILHFNYASICRGDTSLFYKLEKHGITPLNYVSFCSLRTWAELLDTPVTELVYLHTKLLIADDRVVICGSANINDRSLLGTRDSEVCLKIEDEEFTATTPDSSMTGSGLYAGSLRRQLMAEHLGVEPSYLLDKDPVSDTFYKDVWLHRASLNTKIFEDLFLTVPNDDITTFEACKAFEERIPLAEIDKYGSMPKLRKIKGHLVLLPLKFLQEEHLLPSYFVKEGIVPTVTWT